MINITEVRFKKAVTAIIDDESMTNVEKAFIISKAADEVLAGMSHQTFIIYFILTIKEIMVKNENN